MWSYRGWYLYQQSARSTLRWHRLMLFKPIIQKKVLVWFVTYLWFNGLLDESFSPMNLFEYYHLRERLGDSGYLKRVYLKVWRIYHWSLLISLCCVALFCARFLSWWVGQLLPVKEEAISAQWEHTIKQSTSDGIVRVLTLILDGDVRL